MSMIYIMYNYVHYVYYYVYVYFVYYVHYVYCVYYVHYVVLRTYIHRIQYFVYVFLRIVVFINLLEGMKTHLKQCLNPKSRVRD